MWCQHQKATDLADISMLQAAKPSVFSQSFMLSGVIGSSFLNRYISHL